MNSNARKKVVVTGAGGFLGSNLVEALRGKGGYLVYALSSRGEELQKGNLSPNIQYCHRDAVFCDDGAKILKDAIVVNCAFPRNSTGTEMADGLRYIQRLFDCAKENGARAIINISSQSVYSQKREEPATEETPVCLESPYAVGKYAAELMLESACRGTSIAYTSMRMASLIGPGFDQRMVNRFIKKIINGEQIIVNKSKRRFGFLDVKEAVKAIMALIEKDNFKWEKLFNVGNGKSFSMEDLIDTIIEICKDAGISIPAIDYRDEYESGNTAIKSNLLIKEIDCTFEMPLKESANRILQELLNR